MQPGYIVSWLKVIVFLQLKMLNGDMSERCSNQICFTWKVSSANLTLVCRVSQLNHRIVILDPHDTILADCLPPFPKTICGKHNENISVYQNASTNETTMIVSGKIDSHVNGVWTCRHGKQRGLAKVEVTVLIIKETHTASAPKEKNGGNRSMSSFMEDDKERECITKTLLWTMGGFIFAVTTTLMTLSFVQLNKETQTIERCTCMGRCIQENPRAAIGVKRFIFTLVVLLLIVLAYIGALFDQDECNSRWAFLVISILVGILNTILFLHGDKNTGKNVETKGQELHNFNGESVPCMDRKENEASNM